MGQVFHTLNTGKPQPGAGNQRIWFEPGHPLTVLPGVTLLLVVDRIDGQYHSRIVCGAHQTELTGRRSMLQFWAMPRAVTYDHMGRPQRMLLEVSHRREAVGVSA